MINLNNLDDMNEEFLNGLKAAKSKINQIKNTGLKKQLYSMLEEGVVSINNIDLERVNKTTKHAEKLQKDTIKKYKL